MKEETNKLLPEKLPDGLNVRDLKQNWDIAYNQYTKARKRAIVLDAVDRSRMWEALKVRYPKYQVLPDTNHVAYVKNNILAACYTVGRSAQIVPTSENDKDIVESINGFLEHFWHVGNVGMYQLRAGERAALLNIGITQVGWDNELVGGNGDTFYKGAPTYKNIDPLHFMRDPFAIDLANSAYCITWDSFHESAILANPLYKKNFEDFKRSQKSSTITATVSEFTDRLSDNASIDTKYHQVIIHWVRVKDKIHEIHTLDNQIVLYFKENIKPSMFPFAVCYCNLPAPGDLFGTSEPAKIFANSLAYNMMNSMILTGEYKNQRPPAFINNQSGVNIDAFTKHANDPDRVFVVNGDASRAVHYHSYPTPSGHTFSVQSSLNNDIQSISGIDGHYTGRDTGSILTTGGIDSMLSQATLVDAPRLMLYEDYAKQLTKLTLYNLIIHSSQRVYLKHDRVKQTWTKVTVEFPKVPNDTVFDYEINISSELPKNKQRVAEMATELMEKQLQYKSAGERVDWITPEEWLMFQDLPFREYLLERMGLQRTASYVEDTAEVITGFGELTQSGVSPEDAVGMMAQQIQNKRQPMGGGNPYGDIETALSAVPPSQNMVQAPMPPI